MISFFWENIEKSRPIQCCLLLVRLFLHDKMPPQYGVQLDAQIESRALLSRRLDPFSESRNLASDAFNNEQQSTPMPFFFQLKIPLTNRIFSRKTG